MTYADRWLLPDGVEEILPQQARQIEQLRRQLLDLYQTWGYQFVITPLMEFTDSLLIGSGRDVDLLTIKVADQLSGRTLGIRADITPQAARMDAHSMHCQGPNRLCYAGRVLYTRPKSPLATRSPILSGVELFGEAGLQADLEVMSLLLQALQQAGLPGVTLEIGHVGIVRALVEAAQLGSDREAELLELLQRKALAETRDWVAQHIQDKALAAIVCELPALSGDSSSLAAARDTLKRAPAPVLAALDQLQSLADTLQQRYPEANLYVDLSEPHSFAYHTGIVFSAFAEGHGRALASGGRYDKIGEVFGRARPATGFSLDVTALNQLINVSLLEQSGIFVQINDDPAQWQAICALRVDGETVIAGFDGEQPDDGQACNRQLKFIDGRYQVVDC